MTVQDELTNTVRKVKEAWAGAEENLTETFQKAFDQAGNPFTLVDPTAAVDQVFDFYAKALELQRDVAKQLAGATVALGEKVQAHAETVGAAVRVKKSTDK